MFVHYTKDLVDYTTDWSGISRNDGSTCRTRTVLYCIDVARPLANGTQKRCTEINHETLRACRVLCSSSEPNGAGNSGKNLKKVLYKLAPCACGEFRSYLEENKHRLPVFENFEKLNCQLSVSFIRLVSNKMADTPAFHTRIAARGWVSRVSSKLDNLCRDPNVNVIKLSDAISEFDIRINRLESR